MSALIPQKARTNKQNVERDERADKERARAKREEHNRHQGILRLPSELRDIIYNLLAPERVRRLITQLEWLHGELGGDYGRDSESQRFHRACLPALLSVCRQLRADFLPLFFNKTVPSLELREMLEPWVRGRFSSHRRLPFPFVLGDDSLACFQRIEVRCQWRCLECRNKRSISGVPQGRNFVMDDNGMKYSYERWEAPSRNTTFESLHTIDCVAVEIDRGAEKGGISIKSVARVRSDHNLKECCRANANKVAEKLVLEIANMELQDGNHQLSKLDFEMLARRMRWHAWDKRWFYRLSEHNFILAWHDLTLDKKAHQA